MTLVTRPTGTPVDTSVAPGSLLRLPGVYQPQTDSWLLAHAMHVTGVRPGMRVLDLCSGTGLLALLAANHGANVTAVDVSRRAAFATWLNTRRHGRQVQVRRARFPFDQLRGFDLVVANPPYVPVDREPNNRCWDAGPDGRSMLDPLCDLAPTLLSPGGSLLVVHSHVCGVEETVGRLTDAGLSARVLMRRRIPFGPVMWERAAYLETAGLIEEGQRDEEIVVVRADRVVNGVG